MKLLALLLLPTLCLAADRSVAVSGRCEIPVSPDRASIQVRAEKTAGDVAAAVGDVSKRMTKLRADIAKLNLKDLELNTAQYQVQPHHEWENNKNVLKGQRAILGLEVTTSEIPRLGEVMSLAAKHGLTGADGWRTFLSTAKAQAEYLKCLDIAVDDAKVKAERLAKRLNAKLGEVVNVQEGERQQHSPQPMQEMSMARAKDASPPIDVANLTYATSVQVTFLLK
jgi:uncharacterized protein YggE